MDQEPASGLLSVIVPVGAIDDALRQQLDALRSQDSDRQYEVVLACNLVGSAPVERLEDLVATHGDSSWSVVPAAERRGPSYARNVGVRHARGDVLAFCDADDIAEPGWLRALTDALETFDAATGALKPFGVSTQELAARPPLTAGCLPRYMGVPYLLTSNLGVRRVAYEAVGGFDERLRTCEDMAFAWSLLVAGYRIGWAPAAEVRYRYRPGIPAMIRQHFAYGRGISQVLLRYGIPDDREWVAPGSRLLRSNGLLGAAKSYRNSARRVSMAAGRLAGIVDVAAERLRRHA